MKKLAHLMLLGIPVIAFSTAALSADDHTGGTLFKNKYKKTVTFLLNDKLSDCLKLSTGEDCLLGNSTTNNSSTISIIDSATGKILGKYRLTNSNTTVSTIKVEDLSPKSPDAPIVSTEAGNTTVDSSGSTVEQPTVVLSNPPSSTTDASSSATAPSTPIPAAAEAASTTSPN